MKDIKPEMHDVGKLIDKKITEIEHTFENYPGKLTNVPSIKMNPIWTGILHHHSPKNFKSFVLAIADQVAAATSRHEHIGEKPIYNVYKLWNPPSDIFHELSNAIGVDSSDPSWIAEIVEFINKNPSVEEYFEKFGEYLKLRTEDATPGSNITSLWTHSKLTSLLYDFLYDYLEKVDNKWFKLASKDEVRNYISRIKEEMKIKIVKVRIKFPQHPVRIRDLNIFDALEEVKKEILENYPNNIIFMEFNEILFILTPDEELDKLRKIVSKYGFWLEYVERIQNLNKPYPDPDRIMRLINKMQKIQYKKFEEQIAKVPPDKRKKAEEGIRKTIFEKGREAKRIAELWNEYHYELNEGLYKKGSIYADLPDQINPPICEICQLNQATEKWIDEESGIVENLCTSCLNIRKRGSKFPKLDEWEREGANKILWIKIGLDINELINVLEDLYAGYLRSLGVREPEERAEIRFSALSEFDWDYKEFLSKFKDKILEAFGENNFQQILDDFAAVKIKSLKDILTLLRLFDDIFTGFFPKFKEIGSPIKLGVVCSNVKYPFIESWRILSDLKYDVHIFVIGKGEIKLNMAHLTPFLGIKVKNKALLHKLVAVSEISEKLAEIMLYDRWSDRDYKKYKPLRDAVRKFGYQNVLTYAKIMGG